MPAQWCWALGWGHRASGSGRESGPGMRYPQPRRTGLYRRGGKRAVDVVAAGLMLGISLPVQGVVAVLVRRRLGSPVLFRQMRPGLGGTPFVLLKFRSMTHATDAGGQPLSDEQRLTPFGRVLRASSLDELPELWNVVRGDMSLVGPRPLLMEYLPRYTPEQARRHEVRPGLTGLAQVNGRNEADWAAKLALDTHYVDNVTMVGDLGILMKTLRTVLRREGITAAGHATAPVFLGTSGQISD